MISWMLQMMTSSQRKPQLFLLGTTTVMPQIQSQWLKAAMKTLQHLKTTASRNQTLKMNMLMCYLHMHCNRYVWFWHWLENYCQTSGCSSMSAFLLLPCN